MKRTTIKMKYTASTAEYFEAHARAMRALKEVQNLIKGNPEPKPENDVEINWLHVAGMIRIAKGLEEILPED